MEELCQGLGLRGRVRVALDGLNVTVRGTDSALRSHMAAVAAHPALANGTKPFP
jgi:predicted sulfurtransferase